MYIKQCTSKTPLTLFPQQAVTHVLQVVWVCTVGINPLNVNIGFLRIAQVFCSWPHERVGALVLVVWASQHVGPFSPHRLTLLSLGVGQKRLLYSCIVSDIYCLLLRWFFFFDILIKGIINNYLLPCLPLIKKNNNYEIIHKK